MPGAHGSEEADNLAGQARGWTMAKMLKAVLERLRGENEEQKWKNDVAAKRLLELGQIKGNLN